MAFCTRCGSGLVANAQFCVLIVATLVSASAATMAAISVRRMTGLDHGERSSTTAAFPAAPVGQSFSTGPSWDL